MKLHERLENLEKRIVEIEEKQLASQEAIATIYEERQKNNLKVDEVLATIYEEVLAMKGI